MFRPYFTIPVNINGMPVYYNIPYFVENQTKKVADDDLLDTLKKYIDDELNRRDLADKQHVKQSIQEKISVFLDGLKKQDAKIQIQDTKIEGHKVLINAQKNKLEKFQTETNEKIDSQFMLNQLIKQIYEILTSQLSNNNFTESNSIINSINENINIIKEYNINENYKKQINDYIKMLNTTYKDRIKQINYI